MKPEVWISIYAATVGTGALLLNFKNWLDSGAKRFVTLIPDGVIIGGDPQFDEKDLVIVNVINRGQATTMIRSRFRPSESYVVTNPQLLGHPRNIPSDIEPNKKWTGVVRDRPDVIPELRLGNYYVAVHASHHDRSYLRRIPKIEPKPKSDGNVYAAASSLAA